ncbi:MAG: hypothetical protein JWM57_774 [Phycisphaerales bacterium]|nr:hypothetical protein [Phycisphaerales bacterium]
MRRNPRPSPLKRAETVEELTRQNVETITEMEHAVESGRSMGDRLADGFASVVGSWTFIIIQSVLLTTWVTLNVLRFCRHWDPYPFTFLNLALSFQAAYASPIIMMSQNRQGRLSDRRNHLDLQVNLLAEQENTETLRLLRIICEKLDIKVPDRAAVRALEQQTKPTDLVDQIDKSTAYKHVAQPKNLKAKDDRPGDSASQ